MATPRKMLSDDDYIDPNSTVEGEPTADSSVAVDGMKTAPSSPRPGSSSGTTVKTGTSPSPHKPVVIQPSPRPLSSTHKASRTTPTPPSSPKHAPARTDDATDDAADRSDDADANADAPTKAKADAPKDDAAPAKEPTPKNDAAAAKDDAAAAAKDDDAAAAKDDDAAAAKDDAAAPAKDDAAPAKDDAAPAKADAAAPAKADAAAAANEMSDDDDAPPKPTRVIRASTIHASVISAFDKEFNAADARLHLAHVHCAMEVHRFVTPLIDHIVGSFLHSNVLLNTVDGAVEMVRRHVAVATIRIFGGANVKREAIASAKDDTWAILHAVCARVRNDFKDELDVGFDAWRAAKDRETAAAVAAVKFVLAAFAPAPAPSSAAAKAKKTTTATVKPPPAAAAKRSRDVPETADDDDADATGDEDAARPAAASPAKKAKKAVAKPAKLDRDGVLLIISKLMAKKGNGTVIVLRDDLKKVMGAAMRERGMKSDYYRLLSPLRHANLLDYDEEAKNSVLIVTEEGQKKIAQLEAAGAGATA